MNVCCLGKQLILNVSHVIQSGCTVCYVLLHLTGCLNEGSEILRLQCLYEKAGYFDMSRSCISCVSLTGFDYGTLLKNCFVKRTRSNLPGLLVLSKRKLIGPSLTYFDPEKTVFNRAYISFEVHVFR